MLRPVQAMQKKIRTDIILTWIPFSGICLFVLLYYISTFFYPGGSWADKGAAGFSWLNNYFCDLLDEKAKNGQYNSARLPAIVSWVVLCISLSVFWYLIPKLLSIYNTGKRVIQYCGITAMFIASFLFTSLHDIVTHLSGMFGFIALGVTFSGLYKSRLTGFFYTGLFCMVLMGLNYYIMLGNVFSNFLPVVQKITFLLVLLWIFLLNRKLYQLNSIR